MLSIQSSDPIGGKSDPAAAAFRTAAALKPHEAEPLQMLAVRQRPRTRGGTVAVVDAGRAAAWQAHGVPLLLTVCVLGGLPGMAGASRGGDREEDARRGAQDRIARASPRTSLTDELRDPRQDHRRA